MVHPGPSIITCTLRRVSKKQSVLQVELARASKPGEDSNSYPTTTLGIFTYGDISKENGLSQETRPVITRPPPDRLTECVTIDDPVVSSTPVTAKMNWVAPRSPQGLWGHRLGGHNREVWLSFRDGSKLSDVLHLAYLSDLVSRGSSQLTSACVNTPRAVSPCSHQRPIFRISTLNMRSPPCVCRSSSKDGPTRPPTGSWSAPTPTRSPMAGMMLLCNY